MPHPLPPSIRNIEQRTKFDQWDEAQWDTAIFAELRRKTKLHELPSAKMQAWRDYEVQKFGVLGRRGPICKLGYNLYTDCITHLARAYFMAAADIREIRANTGRTARTIPRYALASLAEGYGYRYRRGLEVIEHNLVSVAQQVKFRHERLEFKHALELNADAAHVMNDRGQNRAAALEVVLLFARELLALCHWLEIIGHHANAVQLRNGVRAIIGVYTATSYE